MSQCDDTSYQTHGVESNETDHLQDGGRYIFNEYNVVSENHTQTVVAAQRLVKESPRLVSKCCNLSPHTFAAEMSPLSALSRKVANSCAPSTSLAMVT